jgi:hypothetical protein
LITTWKRLLSCNDLNSDSELRYATGIRRQTDNRADGLYGHLAVADTLMAAGTIDSHDFGRGAAGLKPRLRDGRRDRAARISPDADIAVGIDGVAPSCVRRALGARRRGSQSMARDLQDGEVGTHHGWGRRAARRDAPRVAPTVAIPGDLEPRPSVTAERAACARSAECEDAGWMRAGTARCASEGDPLARPLLQGMVHNEPRNLSADRSASSSEVR